MPSTTLCSQPSPRGNLSFLSSNTLSLCLPSSWTAKIKKIKTAVIKPKKFLFVNGSSAVPVNGLYGV